MAKLTKKLQANVLRLIALERVSLDSYTRNGELQTGATLLTVANVIDSIAGFKSISFKQSDTVTALSDNKVLLTSVSVSPDGTTTATREIVLNLLDMRSYAFLNCL